MEFLANENVPLDVVEAVRKIGHDVSWIRTDAPGSKDRDILQRAVRGRDVQTVSRSHGPRTRTTHQ